ETIIYIIENFGEGCVGFGSDFDGSILPSFDISQLPILTQVMMDRGLSDETIKKVIGGNAFRVLQQVLPA
ncbi:MAG: membrane dipeptidase, partial [Chloroflexota bacterium]